ncbi:MAG: hypothetical protein HZB51_28575 [Chloroflexi bacterium]|nr:hypothetical protein [Chloroflexota bacterium]
MDPLEFAETLKLSINYAIEAHQFNPQKPNNALRFWDMQTPYAIHPIWCAITLLTETKLPDEIRIPGYQALLWHDILEDTTISLPDDASDTVKQLVQDMTFQNFDDEIEHLWEKSDTVKLLKLYDKTSILLDAVWMDKAKWNKHVEHARKLLDFVMNKYGELNIVNIARVICIPK